MNIDFARYYVWSSGEPDKHINKMLTDVPSKAVIFGPEECDVSSDWGQFNNILNSIDLTVVTGAANKDHLPHHATPDSATLILWPTFWMTKTYSDLNFNKIEHLNVPIDNLYISLNNRAKHHRCLMMDKLCNHDLIKYGHISWHMADAVKYQWQHWEPTKLIVDSDNICLWSMPNVYKSTLFNLITESDTSAVFITEKTCTAILYKKPFIVLGAKGFHKVLTDMGFQLYDELFDYAFDNEPDLKARVNGIIDNINNLKDQDYELLRQRVKDKTEHNYNRIIELSTSKKHVPDFMLQYIDALNKNPELITTSDMTYLALEKLWTI